MILGLSATIIGASMDPGALFSVFSGYGRSGGGYTWALGFGMATLFLVASTPVILVGMKGAAVIQRAAVSGLSLAEAEEEITRKMEEMKKRTQEAKEQVRVQVAAAQAKARVAANANTPANSSSVQDMQQVSPAQANCPACTANVGATDMFCGSCGHKLK